MSLLNLAREPSPSLLLLFEPVVPNILNYSGSIVMEFARWLKFLLPVPEYHSKAISFMQQVKDWSQYVTGDYFLKDFKEILEILDEARVGNVGEFRDELETEHVYQLGWR
ncbi:hypothetical protein V5O48_000220 [Marasmius crinis-equi]|uniref:Uncharacterized protein n=1 Tax=Marasmius crinis-equi TaxID=585013 RepID=A0ABR3G218_9AGAR